LRNQISPEVTRNGEKTRREVTGEGKGYRKAFSKQEGGKTGKRVTREGQSEEGVLVPGNVFIWDKSYEQKDSELGQ
jgi:hypothetical protein